ncbi:class I SAM-dependent methyltransferase [Dyella sp. RRB7]|uniref:class I SAM-dependent methyltransferase n=1 Tax=Dyella sp. RRB7 TaxID=2919502 RepID=UPI001FAAE5E0|nr:class I SAM-dependent methyltransferase [Dyella sp. RRB7]
MFELTKKLLGLGSKDRNQADPVHLAPSDEGQPKDELAGVTGLGLRDMVMSGWFSADKGELFRGFSVGPDDTVVDVGCGDGGYGVFCARLGAHVIAIDVDEEVVAAMAKRLEAANPGRNTAYVSDACPLPLSSGLASRVLCMEVLEHVPNPDAVLAELFRVGKPGALYLLTVPDALQEGLQKLVAPPSYFQVPHHIRIIGREEFEQMVTRAGFEVLEHTQHGFFWAVWWGLVWACDVDLAEPDHPALDHWAAAWKAILDQPNGKEYKQKLDVFLPKHRVIVARKPFTGA